MLKNHFKIAYRTIVKQKFYACINIFGMVIGLTSFVIIMLYLRDELSYDQYHSHADRIYRVVVDRVVADGSKSPRIATPGALKEAMLREIPEIEQATRLYPSYWGKALLSDENYAFYDKSFLYVDNSFFNIFSFQFIYGDAKSALADPSSIVLTESFARRFFGNNDSLGQILTLNQKHALKVSGIIEDVPPQSHLKFDFLVSTLGVRPQWDNSWGKGHMHTYIKVNPQASLQEVDAKIQQLVDTHRQQDNQQPNRPEIYSTQPLAGLHGIHLASPRWGELAPTGSMLYIQVFMMVGFFVILIAGINYVNLATARSAMRAKEIGMRKVAGAFRKTLIYQFLTESILVSVVAGTIAFGLAEVVLLFFNGLMQKDLSLLTVESQPVWWLIAAAVLGFGIAAGLYPAFYLSAFKPISVFKKQRASNRTGFDLRKILVVSQFALSAFLMVGMIVVQQQMNYIQSAKLGFDKDQVLVIRDFHKVPNRDRNYVVRHELEALAGVAKVGACNEMIGLQGHGSLTPMHVKGSNNQQGVLWTNVGYNYLDAVGIELKEGRNFSPKFETPLSHDVVILNETAVRRLIVPEPVVGQQIVDPHGPLRTVIGVVKDFHYTSLHKDIKPFVFGWTHNANTVAIKISGGNIQETLSQIEATWGRIVPGVPLDFYFLDEAIDQLYRSEQNFRAIFSTMTGLILIIACLGLFGLAAFTAEQRTKEIGVRKVLGATVTSLVSLLSKDFIKLVLVANLLAWPIAYYAMNEWLQNFAYRIEMSWWIFLMAGVLALLIALLTVSYQAIRVATANPVKSLRYE
jgi:putative ABC transport system permease protein